MARQPPLWLREGESVSVEIESIGSLTNPVQNEAA
jgi:2-keto-4-pentenoate hydratase/2-oxohepta-3-ene-1,7-dioic acid hydratase in catechol pathway